MSGIAVVPVIGVLFRSASKRSDRSFLTLYFCRYFLAFLFLCSTLPAHSQEISLVRDLNQMGLSDSSPKFFVELNGQVYFAAASSDGNELWRYDPATELVTPVADTAPGVSGGAARFGGITSANGQLFFTTADSSGERQLWRHDPASGTTEPLTSFANGVGILKAAGGLLFLVADDGISGRELWRYDPINGDTRMLGDINSGAANTVFNHLFFYSGSLFFSAGEAVAGAELWRYDIANDVLGRVADLNPGSAPSQPQPLGGDNGQLYFSANDGVSGNELWRYTLATGAVSRMLDIDPGSDGSSPSQLVQLGGEFYFTAHKGSFFNLQVWRWNPTTGVLTEILDTPSRTAPRSLTVAGGLLYFTSGINLRIYDPDTGLLGSATPSGSDTPVTEPSDLSLLDGDIYFVARDSLGSFLKLWVLDTSSGQMTLLDETARTPRDLFPVQGRLLFSADDGITGRELWQHSRATADTTRLTELVLGADGSDPEKLTAAGGNLFFVADDGITDADLWRYSPDTSQLTNILPDARFPNFPTVLGDHLYFSAFGRDGTSLWRHGITSGITELVATANTASGIGLVPRDLIALDGKLYFNGRNENDGIELWRHDPATGVTAVAADIVPGSGSSGPREFAVIDGLLYFSAFDPDHGSELWRHDPATETTTRLTDINPDAGNANPAQIRGIDGIVLFTADDGASGVELWRYDPAANTATRAADINSGPFDASPGGLVAIGGVLYFSASDTGFDRELWRHVAATGETSRVMDISPGPNRSRPESLTPMGGLLFFSATDGVNGTELWRHDTVAGTTVRVTDIADGSFASSPRSLAAIEGKLYFSAVDGRGNVGTSGRELWRHDPVSGNTERIEDLNPGREDANPLEMTQVDDELLFQATDGIVGRELFKLSLPLPPRVCDINGDGKVEITDIRLISAARNTASSGIFDPRDVDGDGTITVTDARSCVLRCDLPRCAIAN